MLINILIEDNTKLKSAIKLHLVYMALSYIGMALILGLIILITLFV